MNVEIKENHLVCVYYDSVLISRVEAPDPEDSVALGPAVRTALRDCSA